MVFVNSWKVLHGAGSSNKRRAASWCLGEKFFYVIKFWLAAWIGRACWYSAAMGAERLQKASLALDK